MKRIPVFTFTALFVVCLISLATIAFAQPQQVFDTGTNSNVPLSLGTVTRTLSAASTNATNITAIPAVLQQIHATNTSASVAFLKLIDKASAPTCGSETVKMTIPLPVNQPVQFWPPNGIKFANGISFCVTGLIADADTTNTAAGIAVNTIYQ